MATKKVANDDEEFVTLSVRLPDLLYRDVNVHLIDQREQAQDFVPRAVTGLFEREKDREVVFGVPKTKITGPVTMLSADIEASIHNAMRKHVIKHGEKVQGWNIRAFTEQMKIDSEPLRTSVPRNIANESVRKIQMNTSDEGKSKATSAINVMTVASEVAIASTADPVLAILGAAGIEALKPLLFRGMSWSLDVITSAFKRTNQPLDEFITAIQSSESKQELLIITAEAGQRSSFKEKRNALANALSRGVLADNDIDVVLETRFVRVVDDIDLADVRVLSIMSQPRTLQHRSAFLGVTEFEPEDFGEIEPVLAGHSARILATLARNGLVASSNISEGFGQSTTGWHITAYGRQILDRIIGEGSD